MIMQAQTSRASRELASWPYSAWAPCCYPPGCRPAPEPKTDKLIEQLQDIVVEVESDANHKDVQKHIEQLQKVFQDRQIKIRIAARRRET